MTAPTVTVVGLAPGLSFQTKSNNTYTADITGTVTGVLTGPDLRDLEAQGGRVSETGQSVSTNGLYPITLPILHSFNADGSVVAAAASSGKFGKTLTVGTAAFLVSEAANSSTKTDSVTFDVVLPRNYVAAKNITLTANAQYVLGSGTIGTHTIDAEAYRTASDGTQGVDLINVAAVSNPSTATDVVWTIAGATLNPGDRLVLKFTVVTQDTGSSNITSQINSVRLS